jgi:YVTN family beta-propeller protein
MQVRDRERGSQIADYRIEAVLGRGGMSVVYLAEDLRLKRKVALKLLTPALAEDERFRDRFLRESELAASLDHANVIPIYEAGEADGSLFIAMRYVEGSDLKALLRDGPLSQERAVLLAGQVAAALDAAHERGLVHGDVKPSNVLIDGRGHAYLADFGLTKRVTDERPPAGGEAQLMGTIDYVSPEQIRGEDVDGRADIYSLGCLLYECLTGRQPFKRGNDAAILYAHLEDKPPATDTAADPVLTRALAKSPDDRYQTCGELAEAARQALGVAAPRRSRFPLAIAVLVVAAGVASFLGVYLLRGGGAAAGPHGVLVRIDPKNNKLAGQVSVGAEPTGVAVDSGLVWVTSLGDGSVWQIEAKSLRSFRIADQGSPIGVAARGGTAYVADSGAGIYGQNGQVTAIAAEGGTTNHSIRTNGVSAIASGPDGLWVARPQGAARLAIVSDIVGTVDERVTLPPPSTFSYGALAVGAGSVWVLGDAVDRRMWRINPADGQITATIALPLSPVGIAVGASGVWATGQLEDEVVRIDPATDRVGVPVKVGREPLAVAVGGGAVWVANTIDRTVMRIDPATNRVVATIPVASSPTAITFGDGYVWVAADAS